MWGCDVCVCVFCVVCVLHVLCMVRVCVLCSMRSVHIEFDCVCSVCFIKRECV